MPGMTGHASVSRSSKVLFKGAVPDNANEDPLGSATKEWLAIFLGQNAGSGAYLGLGQEGRLWYDQTSNKHITLATSEELYFTTSKTMAAATDQSFLIDTALTLGAARTTGYGTRFGQTAVTLGGHTLGTAYTVYVGAAPTQGTAKYSLGVAGAVLMATTLNVTTSVTSASFVGDLTGDVTGAVTCGDDVQLAFGAPDVRMEWDTGSAVDTFHVGLSGSYAMVLTTTVNMQVDHDHAAYTNPATIYQAATSPDADNRQWGATYHNQAAFVSECGLGCHYFPLAALEANATMTFTADPTTDSGIVFTINTTTLTGVTGSPGAGEFQIGTGLATTLANIVAAINTAESGTLTCHVNGDTIVFEVDATGTAGNAYVTTETTDTDGVYSFGGATFSGGRAAVTGTPGHSPNHYFPGVSEFDGVLYADGGIKAAGIQVDVLYATAVGTYTLDHTNCLVIVDTTNNAVEINLPQASAVPGQMYTIILAVDGGNNLVVNCYAGDSLARLGTSYDVWTFADVNDRQVFISDGVTGWHLLDSSGVDYS